MSEVVCLKLYRTSSQFLLVFALQLGIRLASRMASVEQQAPGLDLEMAKVPSTVGMLAAYKASFLEDSSSSHTFFMAAVLNPGSVIIVIAYAAFMAGWETVPAVMVGVMVASHVLELVCLKAFYMYHQG